MPNLDSCSTTYLENSTTKQHISQRLWLVMVLWFRFLSFPDCLKLRGKKCQHFRSFDWCGQNIFLISLFSYKHLTSSAILLTICAWIHGLEMQREVEEWEVEDFVRVLCFELTFPSSFLVTVSRHHYPHHQHHHHYNLAVIKSLLAASYSAGCFIYLSSFNPHIKLVRQVLLLPQIYGCGNWSLG